MYSFPFSSAPTPHSWENPPHAIFKDDPCTLGFHCNTHSLAYWSLLQGWTGLSLRARGQGFSPATKRVAPGYFYNLENRRKIEPKEISSRLIPRLLVVFTRQLEILVTTLQITIILFKIWPTYRISKEKSYNFHFLKTMSLGLLVQMAYSMSNKIVNPLSPKSDQHQISPCNINAL